MRGQRLTWRWLPNLKQDAVAEAVGAWKAEGIGAVIRDGAPSHRAMAVRVAGPKLVIQPPTAPELNLPERVFQELRRAVEGIVYATVADRIAVVERELVAVAADPDRPRRLSAWTWIAETLARLPVDNAVRS